MSLERKIKNRKKRRALRVRRSLKTTRNVPRVSVFRSARAIYAQVINDNEQKTVASCSSLELKSAQGDKKAVAKAVGLELANRARENGVSAVRFDRGSYLYHGRVKSLAEGLREGGLQL